MSERIDPQEFDNRDNFKDLFEKKFKTQLLDSVKDFLEKLRNNPEAYKKMMKDSIADAYGRTNSSDEIDQMSFNLNLIEDDIRVGYSEGITEDYGQKNVDSGWFLHDAYVCIPTDKIFPGGEFSNIEYRLYIQLTRKLKTDHANRILSKDILEFEEGSEWIMLNMPMGMKTGRSWYGDSEDSEREDSDDDNLL